MNIAYFFTFSGRMGRLRAFGLGILNLAIFAVLGAALFVSFDGHSNVGLIVLICGLIGVALTVTGFSYYVRRLHDINLSGWNIIWIVLLNGIGNAVANVLPDFWGVLPHLINFGIALWLMLKPGTPGTNRFGPSPFASTFSPT